MTWTGMDDNLQALWMDRDWMSEFADGDWRSDIDDELKEGDRE